MATSLDSKQEVLLVEVILAPKLSNGEWVPRKIQSDSVLSLFKAEDHKAQGYTQILFDK